MKNALTIGNVGLGLAALGTSWNAIAHPGHGGSLFHQHSELAVSAIAVALLVPLAAMLYVKTKQLKNRKKAQDA